MTKCLLWGNKRFKGGVVQETLIDQTTHNSYSQYLTISILSKQNKYNCVMKKEFLASLFIVFWWVYFVCCFSDPRDGPSCLDLSKPHHSHVQVSQVLKVNKINIKLKFQAASRLSYGECASRSFKDSLNKHYWRPCYRELQDCRLQKGDA